MLHHRIVRLSRRRRFWAGSGKRAFDLAIVIAAGPVWAPILLTTCLLVRLGSGSPALFRQVRIGRNGRAFTIYKVRTMAGATAVTPEVAFQSWTIRGDPRVTRIGRYLRRSRLDELPQLINVLRGDMSLVGPRPEAPEVVDGLTSRFTNYECRHFVRPGLTGRCQISPDYEYFQTNAQIARKLQHDLDYVENVSLVTDLLILWHTLGVVARCKGIS